jgi:hypothetical protein
MEGITTLFVFNHIPSHLAMVKCSASRFQFSANAAIYLWFLVLVGFNSHSGNDIPYTLPDELSHCVIVYINDIIQGYTEHIPVHVIKTILKHGFQLVRPALNRPLHGYFLFQFLPIGRVEKNADII